MIICGGISFRVNNDFADSNDRSAAPCPVLIESGAFGANGAFRRNISPRPWARKPCDFVELHFRSGSDCTNAGIFVSYMIASTVIYYRVENKSRRGAKTAPGFASH